ncbi:P-loop containing nucleoside triphosphate hydrolase protein [Mycena vitilis]|nr:P-loop containing nucleoside triphosphate hydrolase protein [Mycena vitilis]
MAMNRQGTLRRMEAITDLAQLSSLPDDSIVACLRERFMTDTIYTSLGTSGLVVLNPHKFVNSSADSAMHEYAANYRDTSPDKDTFPPHIFQLANNVYYHIRRTTQDQSIVFSGESASGKSEDRRLAIKSLLELSVSAPGIKGAKLATQGPASEFVLESFGNARTLFNSNASRFGKYTELQFSDQGIKTLDYYLERTRVSGAPNGERNFRIFYYLVAGATAEERAHMHLLEKSTYRYLGQHLVQMAIHFWNHIAWQFAIAKSPDDIAGGDCHRRAAPNNRGTDDSVRFEQLKVTLKTIGLSKRHVAQTCQLVAAILHLGNLDFTIDRAGNEDAAVVRNTDVLELVAEFLGVHPSDLEQALSYKTMLVKQELCTVFLDPDSASDNRDDLAKTLYSLLFAWLNEHINQRLCKDDFSTFIALIDLPGPQNLSSRPNSLDQFCINLANTRGRSTGSSRPTSPSTPPRGSSRSSSPRPGPSRTLTTSASASCRTGRAGSCTSWTIRRGAPRKTDPTMVEAFAKRWGNHSSFRTGGALDHPTFTVSHFHGPVTYSAEGFLARNLDALNPDFVALLRGGAGGSGSAPRQAHARAVHAAQGGTTPLSPTLGTMNELPEDDDAALGASEGSGTGCVAGEFRSALDTLFATLDETQAWHVFCINPNDSQLPNQLEGRSVRGQVRSAGLAQIAMRCRAPDPFAGGDAVGGGGGVTAVFGVGMTFEQFCERYAERLAEGGVVQTDERQRVEQAGRVFGLREGDVVAGAHKARRSRARVGDGSCGRMKRLDVRQAWREKLTLNILIWFMCGLTAFVIVFLGRLICPTEHVFSSSELASHSFHLSPNNVYTSVRGEVFDPNTIASQQKRAVDVIPGDEGKFDPRVIPLKSWNDYENELWDKESNYSAGSWVPPQKLKNEGVYAKSRTASLYGRETVYEPRISPAPSQTGAYGAMQHYPPPGYQSGRDAPQSSLLPTMGESRPLTSSYLDVPIPTSPGELDLPARALTEMELDRAVQDVLRNADLNPTTEREIRRRLEARFGMDLTTPRSTGPCSATHEWS